MSRKATEECDSMLNGAEREKSCLVPDSCSAHRHYNHLVERGKLVAPMPGMYARPGYWNDLSYVEQHLHMVRALSKKHPAWVFSHHTAAAAYGLYVSYGDIRVIHRSAGYSCKRSSLPICCHEVGPRPSKIVSGIRVTTFEQTVFDSIRGVGFGQALAIADSCCRVKMIGREQLAGIINAHASRYLGNLRVARLAAGHADPRSESGGESIARAQMIRFGYLLPELQVEIADPIDGRSTYRMDFCWELPGGGLLAGELDGHEKYVNKAMTGGRGIEDVLIDERNRESHINAYRIPVMRLTYRDVVNDLRFQKLMNAFGVPQVAEPLEGLG